MNLQIACENVFGQETRYLLKDANGVTLDPNLIDLKFCTVEDISRDLVFLANKQTFACCVFGNVFIPRDSEGFSFEELLYRGFEAKTLCLAMVRPNGQIVFPSLKLDARTSHLGALNAQQKVAAIVEEFISNIRKQIVGGGTPELRYDPKYTLFASFWPMSGSIGDLTDLIP